ncbi:MAG: hypothetical protein V3T05_04930, partial [Myxococcota bacterium]
ADPTARAHPDFGDIRVAVGGAGAALKQARRNVAIALAMEATQKQLDAGERILGSLERAGPSEGLIDQLDEVVAELEKLQDRGRGYRDDKRYAQLAPKLDTRLEVLAHEAVKLHWALDVTGELDTALADAVEEEEAEPAEGNLEEKIEQTDRTLEAFAACKHIAAEYTDKPGYDPEIEIKTRLGPLTLDEAQLACEFRRVAAEQRAQRLRWIQSVVLITRTLNPAVEAVKSASDDEAELQAIDGALTALAECRQGLVKIESKKGYDRATKFKTALGKLGAVKLRDTCAGERRRLAKQAPLLRWRIAARAMKTRADEARSQVKTAGVAPVAVERVDPLIEAVGGFRECAERGDFLVRQKDASIRDAEVKKSELKSIEKLADACRKEQETAQKLLTAARKAVAAGPRIPSAPLHPKAKNKVNKKVKKKKSKKKKKRKKKR